MAKEYPEAFEDEGGAQIPHIPTTEEKENCAFAEKAGIKCLRTESCGSCFYHPHHKVIEKLFARAN